MSEARKLIQLRDKIAEMLGYQRRPLLEADAPYAEIGIHAPVDQMAHDAMLHRIRLEDQS